MIRRVIRRVVAAGHGRWPLSAKAAAFGATLAEPTSDAVSRRRRSVPTGLAQHCVREYLQRLRPSPPSAPPDPIELFMRIGRRDFDVAPLAVASVHEHLANTVAALTVVTPRDHIDQARRVFPDATVFADEDILPADIQQLILERSPSGRSNWVTQQFLTLVYVSRVAQRPCLVWDADLVLLKPKSVLNGGVATLALSLEHHLPYFDLIRRLLPDLDLPAWSSTVAHHLVMDPALLRALFTEIEQRGGRPWWRLILEHIDPQEQSCMADYELYGQWMRVRHAPRVVLDGFRNVGLRRQELSPAALDQLRRQSSIDSVSLHWWM